MLLRRLLTLLLFLPGLPAAAAPMLARYEVRAAGLHVMDVEAAFDLDGPRYQVRTHIRMTGLAGVFASGDQVTAVEGGWNGLDPLPRNYRVEGTWRGVRRHILMEYAAGNPRLLALEPANEPGREPVPTELQRTTTDALSALAKLSRAVALTGRCDTAAQVFDGRRRADYAAHTLSVDRMTGNGAYTGEALRCGFEGRLLAGARGDQDPTEARRPETGVAWVARVLEGQSPLPVRVELPSRFFGTIRVTLISVTPIAAVPPVN